MQIQHNLRGGRTTVSDRNGKRIVTTGKKNGYVQSKSPYSTHGGHSYYSRTSYNNGVASTSAYQGYDYGGHQYYAYQPSSYYSPEFYGWASDSWPTPISFGVAAWGWGGSPWLAYYGFTPYPYYASPAFWLTDYLIAANLQAAYAVAAEEPVVMAQGYPLQIVEHEGTSPGGDSPVWTFNGSQGVGVFTTGNQPLTIERFENGAIAVRRTEARGFTALYVGEVVGNMVSGQVTYYPPDGSTHLGVWQGTITGWAPVAATVAPVAATVPAMPAVLNECEGPWCGTWTWDGAHYHAVWNQGSIATLTVVRWDAQGIVINRVDPAGTTPGNMSTYTGTFTGPNTASGGESGVFQGTPWSLAWTITSPTPLFAVAAPVAVAAAPVPLEGPAPSGSDPIALTPDVKQAIAEEVKAQLAAEKAAAHGSRTQASGDEVPPALDPARPTFVVSADLVVMADGQECSLTRGDVIMRVTDTPDEEQKMNVSVASSKKSDCAQGSVVAVSMDDLQEMRNQFHQKLDAGLKTLASKQGAGKIPKAPNTSTTASAVPPPQPDGSAAQELQQQQAAADQTEAGVKQEIANGPSGSDQ